MLALHQLSDTIQVPITLVRKISPWHKCQFQNLVLTNIFLLMFSPLLCWVIQKLFFATNFLNLVHDWFFLMFHPIKIKPKIYKVFFTSADTKILVHKNYYKTNPIMCLVEKAKIVCKEFLRNCMTKNCITPKGLSAFSDFLQITKMLVMAENAIRLVHKNQNFLMKVGKSSDHFPPFCGKYLKYWVILLGNVKCKLNKVYLCS